MDRLSSAYLGGMAIRGCVVERPPLYLIDWLSSLGYYRGGIVELPKKYCRYSPATLLEHIYFLKGVFETHGDVAGDVHTKNIVIFFKWSKKLLKSLKLLNINILETINEDKTERFIVIYQKRDIKKFLKIVKPVVENPILAEALGLCRRSIL